MQHADENVLISDPQAVPSPHVQASQAAVGSGSAIRDKPSLSLPGPTRVVSLTRDADYLVQHALIDLDALHELQAHSMYLTSLTNLHARGRQT